MPEADEEYDDDFEEYSDSFEDDDEPRPPQRETATAAAKLGYGRAIDE